jgi:hypothetical protein
MCQLSRQHLSYPPGLARTTMLRIEPLPGFPTEVSRNTELELYTIELVLDSTQRAAIAVLQVDFDTNLSNHVYSPSLYLRKARVPADTGVLPRLAKRRIMIGRAH